jgi:hypothetical protein
MKNVLAKWDAAVRRRRAAIVRLLAKIKKSSGIVRVKRKTDLADAVHYGIMDRHRQHWHKINGVWYKNTIRSKQLKL